VTILKIEPQNGRHERANGEQVEETQDMGEELVAEKKQAHQV
jgi:hypothetical protein